MSFLGWMTLAGVLLLLMALSSAHLRRLPVSTSAIYLAIGVALGPLGFGFLAIDIPAAVGWLERVSEIAVIVSLFIGGLHLRLPIRDPAWRAAYILAGPVMVLSIIGVALFAHHVLGVVPALALLVGAVLAPTDPVLATAISVNDAKDEDRMRYGISAEAGLNDGLAFPFVVFALLWAEHDGFGAWTGGWALHRLVWAVPAGLLLGYVLGRGVGRLAIYIRSRNRDTTAPSDFLALALIALAYVAAEAIGAWGFLSVFTAGVGLRGAEIRAVHDRPHPDQGGKVPHPPAEDLVSSNVEKEEMEEPAVAAGVLVAEVMSFGDTAERLLEVILVVIVGVAIAQYWSIAAIPLALALFFIIRPLATLLCLIGSPTTITQRILMGWFGIRGIGSLYYLSYALSHGPKELVEGAIPLTVTVIAASVLMHGLSSQPILARYERKLAK